MKYIFLLAFVSGVISVVLHYQANEAGWCIIMTAVSIFNLWGFIDEIKEGK